MPGRAGDEDGHRRSIDHGRRARLITLRRWARSLRDILSHGYELIVIDEHSASRISGTVVALRAAVLVTPPAIRR